MVQRSSLVSVHFREAISHPYISFFSFTSKCFFLLLVSILFFFNCYELFISIVFMYVGNDVYNYDKGRLMLMLQVRQLKLSNLTFLPCLFRHINHTSHFFILEEVLFQSFFLSTKLYPCSYLSLECDMYKAVISYLEIVCEKSDIRKCIDCP